jgi:hypothetical protein
MKKRECWRESTTKWPDPWMNSRWLRGLGTTGSLSVFQIVFICATYVQGTMKNYVIPEIQGDTALRKGVSLMLKRFMESERLPAADPAAAPGLLALHFAWWLLDHPEELEAAAVDAARNAH